jgi:hypothetical protein
MGHATYLAHKQGMFLHKLDGNSIFHPIEICNSINSKIYELVDNISFIQNPIFHKVANNHGSQIV